MGFFGTQIITPCDTLSYTISVIVYKNKYNLVGIISSEDWTNIIQEQVGGIPEGTMMCLMSTGPSEHAMTIKP